MILINKKNFLLNNQQPVGQESHSSPDASADQSDTAKPPDSDSSPCSKGKKIAACL